MIPELLADGIHDALAVRGCHHPKFGPWECRLVARRVRELLEAEGPEALDRFLRPIGPKRLFQKEGSS